MTLTADAVERMDLNILISLLNMKLRNEFSSLDSLAHYYELDPNRIISRLMSAGFQFDANLNQIR